MRFDIPVFFQTVKSGAYDPHTGNYGPDTVTEELRWASVTNTGAQTLKLVYGDIKQESLTVRLQNPYGYPFDSIRIGEKVYRVDFSRKLRIKQTFVVSEVQGNGKD